MQIYFVSWLHLKKNSRLKYLEYKNNLSLYQNISENMKMLGILKTSIKRDAIIPHVQPIVNNYAGKIEKYERLVRIIAEEGNILSPYSFLQVASYMER